MQRLGDNLIMGRMGAARGGGSAGTPSNLVGTAVKITGSTGEGLFGLTTPSGTALLQVENVSVADRTAARFKNNGTSTAPTVILDDASGTGNSWLSMRVGGNQKGALFCTDSGSLNVYGAVVARFGTGASTVDSTTKAIEVDASGNVKFCQGVTKDIVIGTGALATTATEGFLWISSSAGPPTGVPAGTYAGRVIVHYDTTNRKIYVHDGTAWRSTAALT